MSLESGLFMADQRRKIFNVCDRNGMPSRDEHLSVGRRGLVGCLVNDPAVNLSLSLSQHPRKNVGFLNHRHSQYIYESSPSGWHMISRRNDQNEKNLITPLSGAIVPYSVPIYHKPDNVSSEGEENLCFLSLGRGSVKGKEVMVSVPSVAEGLSVSAEKWKLGDGEGKTKDVLKPRKQRSARKMSAYSFPTNVKNLLSTGIFEGVPVKYVSWSRGKSLKGVIKGTNYLCSCDRCEMKMKVNAYEFEQHAGCDTKHPNNHIYFPSGESLYTIVQKLKGIQNEALFEAIKTASGTPINIKNFLAWKALYESTSNSSR